MMKIIKTIKKIITYLINFITGIKTIKRMITYLMNFITGINSKHTNYMFILTLALLISLTFFTSNHWTIVFCGLIISNILTLIIYNMQIKWDFLTKLLGLKNYWIRNITLITIYILNIFKLTPKLNIELSSFWDIITNLLNQDHIFYISLVNIILIRLLISILFNYVFNEFNKKSIIIQTFILIMICTYSSMAIPITDINIWISTISPLILCATSSGSGSGFGFGSGSGINPRPAPLEPPLPEPSHPTNPFARYPHPSVFYQQNRTLFGWTARNYENLRHIPQFEVPTNYGNNLSREDLCLLNSSYEAACKQARYNPIEFARRASITYDKLQHQITDNNGQTTDPDHNNDRLTIADIGYLKFLGIGFNCSDPVYDIMRANYRGLTRPGEITNHWQHNMRIKESLRGAFRTTIQQRLLEFNNDPHGFYRRYHISQNGEHL